LRQTYQWTRSSKSHRRRRKRIKKKSQSMMRREKRNMEKKIRKLRTNKKMAMNQSLLEFYVLMSALTMN
jgi:hypothetical protein